MAHENNPVFATENGHKVHAALSDPRFQFRTLVGLAKATRLSEQDVSDVIEVARPAIQETKNRNGVPLFCLSE